MLKIIIPANNTNERIYILDILFNEFLGLDYNLEIGSKDYEINLENGKKLVVKDRFFNKYPKDLEYLKLENIPKKIEELDIFSASFFMLTRWEEYVNRNRDNHNRFPATESLAFRQGFLDRPIVNEYVEELKQMLLELDSSLKFKEQKKELLLTHDVDVPLLYPNLFSGYRDILGDILKRKKFKLAFNKILTKYLVLINQKKDPYDTFEELMDLSESLGIKSYFFFMAKGDTIYDNFYKSSDKFIQELIKKIKERGHYIGIHPTYNAYNSNSQFKKEKKELEVNLQTDIKFGREHYLRFEVPTTWQIWEDNCMEWDSSCGYADRVGFRCGTGDTFSVFNILTREKLKLKERPLIVMDCSLFDYSHYSYSQAKEKIEEMRERSNQFTMLWHNSYIGHIEFYKEYLKDTKKMTIAYIVDYDINTNSGVLQKIKQQVSVWNNLGEKVFLVSLKTMSIYNANYQLIYSLKKLNLNFGRVSTAINMLYNSYWVSKLLDKIDIDIIYMRYRLYMPFFNKVLQNRKVVMEINSDDLEEYKLHSNLTHIYNKYTRNIFLKYIDGFVSISDELKNRFKYLNKPIEVIANGINTSEYKPIYKTTNHKPILCFIGSPNQFWHGIDKIIAMSNRLKEYKFYIIGTDGINSDNLKYFGYLSKDKSIEIIKKCDIGIGTLSLYKKGLTEASPLKTRQYLACGLPIIYAYKDTDLEEDVEFALRVPNSENNIDDNKIKKFVEKVFNNSSIREEARSFAQEHLDYNKKEKMRLEFFYRIIDE